MIVKRVFNRMGRPFGVNPFPRAFESAVTGDAESAQSVFDEIYRQNLWGSKESRSGVGSEREFTERYGRALVNTLQTYQIDRVFDAPCGDLNWMSSVIQKAGIDYSGGDISTELIAETRNTFPDANLKVFDITSDVFPDADVWHCRDCLFHLPFGAIELALKNFASSTIPYALITSHRARLAHRNLDVGYGGFRLLDLERPPFSLPKPLLRIADYRMGRDFPRFVCLWTRQQVAERLEALQDPTENPAH